MENKKAKKISALELEISELEARLAPDGYNSTDPNSPKGAEGGDKCGDLYDCPQGAEC